VDLLPQGAVATLHGKGWESNDWRPSAAPRATVPSARAAAADRPSLAWRASTTVPMRIISAPRLGSRHGAIRW